MEIVARLKSSVIGHRSSGVGVEVVENLTKNGPDRISGFENCILGHKAFRIKCFALGLWGGSPSKTAAPCVPSPY